MSVTARRLVQATLGITIVAVYTTPPATRTQITEIWLANNNTTTARRVTLRTHGTAVANTIIPSIEIAANGTQIIDSSKIVLTAGQVLAALQDAGTDVILTAYGVEEVV